MRRLYLFRSPLTSSTIVKSARRLVHIAIEGALNFELKTLWWKDNITRKTGNIDIWRPGFVLTTITTVITIVSLPEFLLFKV